MRNRDWCFNSSASKVWSINRKKCLFCCSQRKDITRRFFYSLVGISLAKWKPWSFVLLEFLILFLRESKDGCLSKSHYIVTSSFVGWWYHFLAKEYAISLILWRETGEKLETVRAPIIYSIQPLILSERFYL